MLCVKNDQCTFETMEHCEGEGFGFLVDFPTLNQFSRLDLNPPMYQPGRSCVEKEATGKPKESRTTSDPPVRPVDDGEGLIGKSAGAAKSAQSETQ